MKWVPDALGRFAERPHYEREEIDHECEALVATFLTQRYGAVRYPITTDDLTVLLEQHTSDLDLYAEFGDGPAEIQGVTLFLPNNQTMVRIAKALQEPYREVRLRTTLTHELGHVKLHSFLWAFNQLTLFKHEPITPRCNRDAVHGSDSRDWMEWQARYASGAYLMPLTAVQRVVRERSTDQDQLSLHDAAGQRLVHKVATEFQVSADAARVRLLQLGLLTEHNTGSTLLG